MRHYLGPLLSGLPFLFAAFSSSTSYQLQNYGINGAASNSSASTTYQLETATGQVQSIPSNSTSYNGLSGSIQAQQSNVPPAPTLSNGNNTYFNKLGLIINTGGNPSDTTYAVAISSNNFSSTSYVQADGTLGATPLFQTYTQWGGASGSTIVGLSASTAYEVKVSAMQGTFTNSAYGPFASATTASPSLTFSITPNTVTIPSLLSGTVQTGPTMTTALSTNASFGGSIYISDSNAGLRSVSHAATIASTSTNLTTATHGYGLQGLTATQTSGGPLTISSPFNGTANNVGALTTTPHILFSSGAAITGGSATAALLAKASSTDPAANDYSDTLTFIAAASF
jgi:hypothetical protein